MLNVLEIVEYAPSCSHHEQDAHLPTMTLRTPSIHALTTHNSPEQGYMVGISKVTGIFELLEAILHELPFRQLYTIQRVNIAFRDTITSSALLRRAMLLEHPGEGMGRLQPFQRSILTKCLYPFLLWHDTAHITLIIDPENILWARGSVGCGLDRFSGLYPCERRQTWRGIKVGQVSVRLEQSAFLLDSFLAGKETTMGDAVDWAIKITMVLCQSCNTRRWLHRGLLAGIMHSPMLDEESDNEQSEEYA